MMTDEVQRAVGELEAAYPGQVRVRPDGEGGAYVLIEGVVLGAPYTHSETWVGFRILFQYPNADTYPHFVRGDLARADGQALGEAMTTGHTFEERPAVQLSRRSNRHKPATDTALLKLEKVLAWMRARP